jgi:hypothetical protein
MAEANFTPTNLAQMASLENDLAVKPAVRRTTFCRIWNKRLYDVRSPDGRRYSHGSVFRVETCLLTSAATILEPARQP